MAIIVRGIYQSAATVWLRILNPCRKSVATRVIRKNILKQIIVQILHINLLYMLELNTEKEAVMVYRRFLVESFNFKQFKSKFVAIFPQV